MSYRLWIVFFLILFTPGAARADWPFTPVLGPTFGADTIGREHVAFGATVGWRDGESFGLELDAFLSPNFFDEVFDGPVASGHFDFWRATLGVTLQFGE